MSGSTTENTGRRTSSSVGYYSNGLTNKHIILVFFIVAVTIVNLLTNKIILPGKHLLAEIPNFEFEEPTRDSNLRKVTKTAEAGTGNVNSNEQQEDENGDDDDNDDNDTSGEETENKDKSSNNKQTAEKDKKDKAYTKLKEEMKENTSDRMNIVLLYPDDWRHDSIGSEKPVIRTPFLNQLANEGIRFTQNAVTTSICWMSRATLFTGQFSSRHQSIRLECPHFVKEEPWKHSWPYILQKNDYFVGHVGKWQYYNQHPSPAKMFNWTDIHEGHHWYSPGGGRPNDPNWDGSGNFMEGAKYSRSKAIDFLNQRPKSKPFALTVAFYPPKALDHSTERLGGQLFPPQRTRVMYDNVTLEEPETIKSFAQLPEFLRKQSTAAVHRFEARYRTSAHYQAHMKNYYALITSVDEACKEIVEKLKEDGLYNNTMVIFTTDNGMSHGAHGLAGKWYPFQESIRVPLIIYDPRMPEDKIGTLDDSFTLNIDLAETILGAAGLPADDRMQGRDIADLYLKDNKVDESHATASADVDPWRDEFFYEFPYDEEPYLPSSTALVRKDWKYINWPKFGYEQLFDLKNDPMEFKDMFNDTRSQSVLAEMKKRHDEVAGVIQEPMQVCDRNLIP